MGKGFFCLLIGLFVYLFWYVYYLVCVMVFLLVFDAFSSNWTETNNQCLFSKWQSLFLNDDAQNVIFNILLSYFSRSFFSVNLFWTRKKNNTISSTISNVSTTLMFASAVTFHHLVSIHRFFNSQTWPYVANQCILFCLFVFF